MAEKHSKPVQSKTPEYRSWVSMRARCRSKTNPNWPYYGGRGIKVCRRWNRSFLAFLKDMGPRPSLRYSLDRIDVNGHYEPGNCRWATAKEQALNRRNNHWIECGGVTKSLSQWARESGNSEQAITARIASGWEVNRAIFAEKTDPSKRRWLHLREEVSVTEIANKYGLDRRLIYKRLEAGWSISKAIGAEVRRGRRYTAFGKTLSVAEWVAETGVSRSVLRCRIRRNWPIEDALTKPIGSKLRQSKSG